MSKLAFINYRRSDSSAAARAIYEQLQFRFGHQQVFMDVSSIAPSEKWPQRILDHLGRTNILISVIGENWLSAADKHHRRRIELPQRCIDIPALSTAELYEQMKTIPRWELVETELPGEYPKTRTEIRRTYSLCSFNNTLKFMNQVAPIFNKANHHPRWENQWRTLTIHLSTWDIGHKVSKLDLQIAQELDEIHQKFTRK